MRNLTTAEKNVYEDSLAACPACGHFDTEQDDPQHNDTFAIDVPCYCPKCGATWVEFYVMTRVMNLKTKEEA